MSYNERNKGILIPTNVDTEHFTDEDFECFQEEGFMVIDSEIYSVEWEIKRGEPCEEFAKVNVLDDGRIKFHTQHYNGCGSLEDVIENAL